LIVIGISRKADYALVVLAELAELDGEPRSAAELGARTGIAVPVLRNVLKDLARAGLLAAVRGPFGGYVCARDPRAVTVLDAVDAVGDHVAVTRCCEDPREAELGCEIAAACRIRPSVNRLQDEIVALLRGTSLADLTAAGDPGSAGGRGLPVVAAACSERDLASKRNLRRNGERS
jgi:Rrf2 family transcriptional regulator, iron-sulfur cluster assembly transcription factor